MNIMNFSGFSEAEMFQGFEEFESETVRVDCSPLLKGDTPTCRGGDF